MNQQVTFLSDGGDDVRQIQQYLNPEAEYWLDWFHITMRITVMKQMAKGLANEQQAPAETGSLQAEAPTQKSIEQELQSLKWNLWHGSVECALERIEDLQWELEFTIGKSENQNKLLKQLRNLTPTSGTIRITFSITANGTAMGNASRPALWNQQ